MDKRFLAAFIDPAPFRLLGRSLYPWCLKYRVRLMAFDSPLITSSRPVTPADLIFACQVCAEEPLGAIGWVDRWRLGRLVADPIRFATLLNAFAGYVLVDNWPKFWEQTAKKGGGSKGVPWPLSVVSSLITHGIEEKRAWEMPECQAIWLNSALAISKGADVAIMSPEEEAFMAEEEAKASAAPASNPAKETP
tara:strand:+ start:714 stop:1292 length:579 start_codon:yes stop_codon:yes gene_type:complete